MVDLRLLVCGVFALLIILNVTILINTFPNGAPLKHCEDLTPTGHIRKNKHNNGTDPQTSTIPFKLESNDLGGSELKISLEGLNGEKFKGFIIKALNQNGEYFGRFKIGSGNGKIIKPLNCGGKIESALTHVSNDDKDKVEFIWIDEQTKENNSSNEVFFHYTIVQKFPIFWVNKTEAFNKNHSY